MKLSTRLVPVVLAGIISAPSALAATVSVNLNLDLNDLTPGFAGFTAGVQGTPPFSPAYSVQLMEGDTLDLAITFGDCKSLTIDQLQLIWLFSYSDLSTDVNGTGTISFLGPTGVSIYTSPQKTDEEGSVHFGQFFFNPADLPSLSDPITFSGLRYTGTINDYIDPSITVRTYEIPSFLFNAAGYTINHLCVPDSTSGATVLAGGVLALGWYGNRKRRQA